MLVAVMAVPGPTGRSARRRHARERPPKSSSELTCVTIGDRPRPVEQEAAEWMAKLDQPVVGQRSLADFRAWREDPDNDTAYRALQSAMRQAGRLVDDPDIRHALAQVSARPGRRSLWRRAPAATAMAASGLALAAVLLMTFRSAGETYRTLVGVRSIIHLADGSTVQLDTDSRLRVVLTPRARQLRLERGQAFFDVAHDAGRPFVVTAGDLQVTAVGTRFDVRRDSHARARVVLVQGRVMVRADGGRRPSIWALAPGQALATDAPAPRPVPVKDETATSWTSGELTFHDASLSEVLAETNRYSRQHVRLASDPRLDRVRVDGVFTAGDNASLVQALGDLYGLRADPASDGGLVLRSGD